MICLQYRDEQMFHYVKYICKLNILVAHAVGKVHKKDIDLSGLTHMLFIILSS
jgi:hypothetical protein